MYADCVDSCPFINNFDPCTGYEWICDIMRGRDLYRCFLYGPTGGLVVGASSGLLIDLISGYPQWAVFH